MTQAARAEQPPAPAPRAKKPTLHVGAKVPAASPAAPIARIVPSAPQPFPLIRLLRAPENVRHVRVDEDVQPLADDIAAHGLLQSLIGYVGKGDPTTAKVMIVGGGRRFQALMKLWEAGSIDGTFLVPVLIRGIDEAIELSLAENLQQRTMSPVDEFHAFKALMDRGDTSPRQLAARFGFSEAVVKQRLRLADLVPEVLDALAERKITIDAAQAYASTQDPDLQLAVFKVQDRKGVEAHRASNIRWDVQLKGMRTTDPIFVFIGEAAYEAEGGGYEDDLFVEGADTNREGRQLDKPFLARAIAERLLAERAPAYLDRLRSDPKLAPTIVGYVAPDTLRMFGSGEGRAYPAGDAKLKAPAGFVDVDRRYSDENKAWKAVRENAIDVCVVIGVTDKAEIVHYRGRLFVPRADKSVIERAEKAGIQPRAPEPTPEERAELARQVNIRIWAKRLAVGSFAGTPWEGRALWHTQHHDNADRRSLHGEKGWMVPLSIFVPDAAVDAATPAAAEYVDREVAERAALQRRRDELNALDPEPVVILVDGLIYYRWANGSYWDEPEPEGDEQVGELGAHRLYGLLRDAREIGAHWPSIEAYRG